MLLYKLRPEFDLFRVMGSRVYQWMVFIYHLYGMSASQKSIWITLVHVGKCSFFVHIYFLLQRVNMNVFLFYRKSEQNPDLDCLCIFDSIFMKKKIKIISDQWVAPLCNKKWKFNIIEKISCFIASNVVFQVYNQIPYFFCIYSL